MIYILAKSGTYDYGYMDLYDIVILASTKIDDILDYLYNNVEPNFLSDYDILIKENGYLDYGIIGTTQISYDTFTKYTPNMFLKEENKNEFEHVKNQLRIWCDAVAEKKKLLEEERKRIYAAAKEKQERKLYEELKAKYGD